MEERRIKISVPDHKAKERIDLFLVREIAQVTRSQIQRLIKDGLVSVDGKKIKSHHHVHPSEKIEVFIPKPCPPEVLPEDIQLDIIYEDDFLLIVNKKAGMVVHPAFGHSSGTLVNALLAHCKKISGVNDPYRPGIVHRIDKDTSGLLVVAKDDWTHGELARQFEKKSVTREYSAVVWGSIKNKSGTVETMLGRSHRDRKKISVTRQGKNAVTHFDVIERFSLASLLNLKLDTGRTHQIRVHLAHLGHPVFGDHTYGGRSRQLIGLNKKDTDLAMELLEIMKRQALHARTLGFIHPKTGEKICFNSELPEDMKKLINRLKQAK